MDTSLGYFRSKVGAYSPFMACIVSAYYKIPSKKPHEWYLPYLLSWFRAAASNTVPVHFFTTEDVREELESLTDISRIQFHILPFEQLSALQLGRDFWHIQYVRDPERYHTPELGMIWYEKRHFIRRVMEIETGASAFIWCDAGCIRNDGCEEVAKELGRRVTTYEKGRMYLQCIKEPVKREFYQYPDEFIACGILAGDRGAWKEFIGLYEVTVFEYTAAGIPTISDQHLTSRCVYKRPDLFLLWKEDGKVDGTWFKFLELL